MLTAKEARSASLARRRQLEEYAREDMHRILPSINAAISEGKTRTYMGRGRLSEIAAGVLRSEFGYSVEESADEEGWIVSWEGT